MTIKHERLSDSVEIYNADCIDVFPLLENVDLQITSPPYFNIREYSQWSSYELYLKSMFDVINWCAKKAKPGRHVCWNVQSYIPDKINGERYHYPVSSDIIRLAYSSGLMLETTITWRKTNSQYQRMFGSYPYPPTIIYTPNVEDIHIFRKPGTAKCERSDSSKITKQEWSQWTLRVWDIAIDFRRMGHSAIFPEELPHRLIRLHSLVDDIVLDCFGGIFTTGVACIRNNRRFIGIEKNEDYYEIGKRRLLREISEVNKMF